MQDCKKEQKNGLNEEKPTIKQSAALKGANHKRMGNQKTTHAIRSQGWTVECAEKPPDHGERMSSKQILDIHKSGACARPRHHQPVLSQYRKGWVMSQR